MTLRKWLLAALGCLIAAVWFGVWWDLSVGGPPLPSGQPVAHPPTRTGPSVALGAPSKSVTASAETVGRPSSLSPVRVPSAPEPPPPVARPPDRSDNAATKAIAAFDAGDYDEALAEAQRVLASEPDNVRMLRIVVTVHCNFGDAAAAKTAYEKLPDADKRAMETRCARFDINLRGS